MPAEIPPAQARGQHPSARWRPVAAGLLLVGMTLVAYSPVLRAGFIWDDDAYVTANPNLRTLDGLRRIWLEPAAVPQYYPLTFTSFWVEYHLWGLQPYGYHLVNVLLHALVALLVWRVLLSLHVPAAWLAAAVFALHPMHVESVAWITERKNVLSGVLALAALLVALRAGIVTGGSRVRWPAFAAVYVLFLGALLSKSVTCTLPAVLLLLAWWRGTLDRRVLWRLAPLALLGAGMAAVTVWMERHHVGAEGAEWTLSVVERGLVGGRALWFYPRTLLWPRRLTFIYPRWSIDAQVWWEYGFALAAVAVLAALYASRHRLGRGPLIAVLCYAALLAPTLGFINVYAMRYSFVADHFGYLPSIALIALASAAGATLASRSGSAGRIATPVARTLLLLVLAWLTARQCGVYRDLRTLWTDTLAKNPACWMAHNNLAMVLVGAGQRDDGIAHYREAVRLKPDFADAYNNLGVALADEGKLDEAAAQFESALRANPQDAQAHSNLGNILRAQGRIDAAIAEYTAALQAQPDSGDAHYNLATLLAEQGKLQEAVIHFQEALRRDPESAPIHNSVGNLLRRLNHLDLAIAQYEEALRIQPAFAEAENNLGVALAMQGRSDAALAHLEQALRLRPDYVEALSNAGNVLQAEGRLADAVAAYGEALRLEPTNADAHNNLGMALLAQRNAAAAIAHFQDAVRLKPDSATAQQNLTRALQMQQEPAAR